MILKLIKKKKEINDIKTFIFKPERPISWIAGQYLIYTLDHENKDLRGKMRFFTISSPLFKKYLSITTRIIKKPSSFKKSLDNLKIGDTISAKGPDGDFILENEKNKHIFIAGGIGINPFYSIIKQLNFEKKPINVLLLYANRSKSEVLYKKDFEDVARDHKEFKIHYFFSPDRIDKSSLKKLIKDYKTPIFYISGPDPMVAALEKTLEELGVPKEHSKQDYFSGYTEI